MRMTQKAITKHHASTKIILNVNVYHKVKRAYVTEGMFVWASSEERSGSNLTLSILKQIFEGPSAC